MYFYLKEPRSDKATLIYLIKYIKSEGKNFKYSTGQKIVPENWDFENRMPKAKRGGEGIKNRHIATILEKYAELLENNEGKSRQELRIEFEKEFKGLVVSNRLTDQFQEFIDINKKSGGLSEKWIEKYNNVLKKLQVYEAHKKRPLYIKDIDQDWFTHYIGFLRKLPDDFPDHLKEKFKTFDYDNWGYNDNTLHRHINFIITFLNWADGKLFDKPKIKNPINKYQSDHIYLTESEVEAVEGLSDLSPALEKARDLFLVGIYSGQRFSDFSVFEQADIEDGFIIKKSQKLRKVSYVPIIPKLLSILEKYNYRLPVISSQKLNDGIKKVCKKAGMLGEFKEVHYYGSRNEVRYYKRYEKAGTHTARRTFITLSHERGVSLKTIAEVTGLTIATLIKTYLKTSKETIRREIMDKWG